MTLVDILKCSRRLAGGKRPVIGRPRTGSTSVVKHCPWVMVNAPRYYNHWVGIAQIMSRLQPIIQLVTVLNTYHVNYAVILYRYFEIVSVRRRGRLVRSLK